MVQQQQQRAAQPELLAADAAACAVHEAELESLEIVARHADAALPAFPAQTH